MQTNYSEYTCPVKNAASIIGDKWTLFILRELYYSKPRQGFNELQNALKPISSRTLAKKLKALQEHGLVSKEVLRKSPPKVEYSLTHKGNDLKNVLKELAAWHKSISK
jgi:DNA-binding HxlR family transcriptional regulator